MLHYLPGCDVRKNHPEAIKKLTIYMKNQGAQEEVCCRSKEKLLNKDDVMVNNCTLCDIILREMYPDNKIISTYEYVLNDPNFPWIDHHGQEITIQDCLRTKDNKAMLDAIRECLKKMNFKIIELDENYEKTNFDGVWIYNKPMQICLDLAPKAINKIMDNYYEELDEYQQTKRMEQHIQQYPSDLVLTYCNGCERGLKRGGISPVHLVELISEGL